MRLIETLQAEHALIDRMLGAFCAYVDGLAAGGADPADGKSFAAFFTLFAAGYHHAREEGLFLAALVREARLPERRGPVWAVTREHALMASWLGELAPLLGRRPGGAAEGVRLQALTRRYAHALWRHIDAETSVLYPEGVGRLRLCGLYALPDRAMTGAEAAARDGAEALLRRYPPVVDATLLRGDGCFLCQAHGLTCEGLEAEWWSELEWDAFYAGDVSD